MTYIYVLLYIAIGLGIAKYFQKWIDKDPFAPSVDMGAFLGSIVVWPLVLLVLVFVGLVEVICWFYNLGNKS